jgi:hypothetical protein
MNLIEIKGNPQKNNFYLGKREFQIYYLGCNSKEDAESRQKEAILSAAPINSKLFKIIESSPTRAAGLATGTGLPPIAFNYAVGYYK